MGVVIRQSIKTVAVTLTGALMGVVINLLSIKFFDPTEFGFTQNLIKIALLISYISGLGFYTTIVIYGQKYDKKSPKRSAFLTLSIIAPLISSIVVTLLYYILRTPIVQSYHSGDDQLMNNFYSLFPLLTFLMTIIALMEGYLQSLYKTAIQSLAREILNRVVYILLILLYAVAYLNFSEFIWWYVIMYLVPIIYLGYFIYRLSEVPFLWDFKGLPKKEVKQILGFSFNQTIVILSVVLILQIDSVLVGPLSLQGLGAIAIYSTAMFAISMMRNPIRSLGLAAMPSLSKSYHNIQLKELRRNFNKSVISIQIIVVFCSVGLVLCMPEIQSLLNVWKPGYEQVGMLILIMLVGNGTDLMSGLSYEVISLSKYYKYNTLFAIVCLVIIILLIALLINDYGLIGVAWASSIGLVVYAMCKAIFIYKKFKIHAYNFTSLKVLAAGIVASVLPYFLSFDNAFVGLFVKGGVYLVGFGALVIVLNIAPDINQILKKFLPEKYR